jgi:hypothetical protein
MDMIIPFFIALLVLVPLTLFFYGRNKGPADALLLKIQSAVGGDMRTKLGRPVLAIKIPDTNRECFLSTSRVKWRNEFLNIVSITIKTNFKFHEHFQLQPFRVEHKVLESIGFKDHEAGHPEFDKLFYLDFRDKNLMRTLLPLSVQELVLKFHQRYEVPGKSDLGLTLNFGRLSLNLYGDPQSNEELRAFVELGTDIFKTLHL